MGVCVWCTHECGYKRTHIVIHTHPIHKTQYVQYIICTLPSQQRGGARCERQGHHAAGHRSQPGAPRPRLQDGQRVRVD